MQKALTFPEGQGIVLPRGVDQAVALASMGHACDYCHAQPHKPCTYVGGDASGKSGEPRLGWATTHGARMRQGRKTYDAWATGCWPGSAMA